MITFSIIFPTYGVEEYIEESIKDVLAQSFGDWELIIVDDCSPDASGAIADEYARRDPRIKVIHREKNRGVGEARNLGIEHARGEYIIFLDPDDRYSHSLLETVSSWLDDGPDAVLYSLREDYYSDGEIVYSKDHIHPTVTLSGKDAIYPELIELEQETMYGYPWNKAFKRSLIEESGVKFKRLVHVEDILFNVDIFDHITSLHILEDQLVYYRNQLSSRDRRLTEKYMADYFRVQKIRVRRLLRQYQDRKGALSEEGRRRALNVFASEYYRSYMSMIERELRHGTTFARVWRMAREEQGSSLNRFLGRFLSGGSRAARLMYTPLSRGRLLITFAEVYLIIAIKTIAPGIYDRLKQMR